MNNSDNRKPIRLLIFTESFHPYTSGIARRFKTIIEHLVRTEKYVIHIISGTKGCETAWQNDKFIFDKVTYGKHIFAINLKDKIECALPFVIPQPLIIYEIIKFKPDIIHIVESTPASHFCAAIAKSLKIPIVWSSHTNIDYYLSLYVRPISHWLGLNSYKLVRRTFLNLAEINLTVSKDFANLLIDGGVKQPVHVWRTGVDEKVFSPDFKSEKMRKRMFNGVDPTNRILFLSVGRLSPEKNYEFLIGILKEFPQAFLCIVGDGPYKNTIKPLFPKYQSHFMGFLEGEELSAAYASADYFLYASVSETFGQVYLESMSSGVPIIAAEGKQMKEFFTNGKHGYIWEPDNLKSAINAVDLTMKSRDKLAIECRKNALNHSWSNAGNQIDEMYTKIERKKEQDNNNNFISILVTLFQFVFYITKWAFLMLMVLSSILPFLQVSKPKDITKQDSSSKHKKVEKTKSMNDNNKCIHSFLRSQLEKLNYTLSQSTVFIAVLALSVAIMYSFI